MKRILLIALLVTAKLVSQAQLYGNEWIDYSQVHYKIKVTNDGIYRIYGSVLASYIPNLSALNASNFVMYHNGIKDTIYVTTSASMGPNDYIEFYGKHNTGDLESALYPNDTMQAHPYYSLFNDTGVYYLTISNNPGPHYSSQPNVLTNLPPKESYFIYPSRQYYTGTYVAGQYVMGGGEELFKSVFDLGEGYGASSWFGNFSGGGQTTNQAFTIPTPAVYIGGPAATYKGVFLNYSPFENHIVDVQLNSNYIYFQTPAAFGFKFNRLNISVPVSQISSGNSTVVFSTDANDHATSNQQNMVMYNEIDYPRTFDFAGQNSFFFTLDGDPVNRKYLEITNFNDNGQQPVLYDLTNGYFITSSQAPGNYTASSPLKFALPVSAKRRDLYLISGLASTNAATVHTVSTLQPIAFANYSAANIAAQGDYLIISDSSLDVNGDITAYRNYRDITSSPSTGKFNARIYFIDQLYDQFGYGVRKSPLAIRNFIQYALANWSSAIGTGGTGYKPKQVFLIGKGREYPNVRTDAFAYNQCLIPTFGYPGSDNLLAATRTSDLPTVGIGRLAAQTTKNVSDYLDKIRDYEAAQSIPQYGHPQDIPGKLWQKQVLHFSGGTSSVEQIQFRSYLDADGAKVQDTLWGANVTTYSKTSNAPISTALAQVIKGQIDQGVSLISFFGHSATGAFDFSIDEPENYTNYQKYPVIVSNGCFSGFIHDVSAGYSERFVMVPKAGAIAFMATSSLSLADGLNAFSSALYTNLSGPKYFNNFGSVVKQTLTDEYTCCSGNSDALLAAYEMTLHGDPGLTLNQYPKPDYALDQHGKSIFFTPGTVTPGLDSFKVNVIVTNLGKAIHDTIAVSLTRTIYDENGNPLQPFIYKKYVRGSFYIDTVSFTIPTRVGIYGLGDNLFSPYLDADYKIDEMDEANNGATAVTINIQSDDIVPIYPYEFAIDSDKQVTLKASTTNPFAHIRAYDFEIDTTQLFNSAAKQSGQVVQSGGVVHWTPSISGNPIYYRDSVVYYWRVKIDTSSNWHYTSFEHINGQYGWNQSHLFQWLKDDFVTLQLDSNSRQFNFPNNTNNIHVLAGWTDADYGGPVPYETMGYNLNNSNLYRFRMGSCGFLDGITFAVVDPVKGVWQSTNYNGDDWGDKFGNYHCHDKAQVQYGFDFATSGYDNHMGANWTTVIKNFIDSIPSGAYVLIYSTDRPNYAAWDNTLLAALSSPSIGFNMAVTLQNGSTQPGPFVYFCRKDSSASYPSVTRHLDGYGAGLVADFNFNASWFKGIMTSPVIGPARSWSKMQWRRHAREFNTADKDTVDIYGITSTGSQTLLRSTSLNDNAISNISATTYPYLQLKMRTEDDSAQTPTQLEYWRVLYQKVPEAAINPAAWFKFTDSINLGGDLSLEIGLENVTKIRMDSMLTKYTIRDISSANTSSYIRYSPLPGLDTLILKFKQNISTNNYLGINKLILEANPNGDQLEQFHFNNFAEINFTGKGDKSNPLLDVTFDGQHIFSGDIISSKPDVLITLRDNSKYFALNDTSNIDVFIKYPNTTTPVRVAYDQQTLKFYPADSTNLAHGNKAQAEYKPVFVQDGTYELMVRDKNHSGAHSSSENRYEGNTYYDYKTSFDVINKPMITNVLNYPNPFTTSTKFVFTITGSEIPDIIKIQIINIKGTVVKEINKDELGSIHIGRNITDYAWDGRDQYGDALANGVYFYHVVTRLDNKNMDQMSMSYDKYFKKGFGKMVMIR